MTLWRSIVVSSLILVVGLLAYVAGTKARSDSVANMYVVEYASPYVRATYGASLPLLVTGPSRDGVIDLVKKNYTAWRGSGSPSEVNRKRGGMYDAEFRVATECTLPGWAAVVSYRFRSNVAMGLRWGANCGAATPADAIRKATAACEATQHERCDREQSMEDLYLDLAHSGPISLSATGAICWTCDIHPLAVQWAINRIPRRGDRETTTHSVQESIDQIEQACEEDACYWTSSIAFTPAESTP